MTLKAPPRIFKKQGKKKRNKRSGTRDLVVGGTGALLGVALVSSTADALSRI